MPERILLRGRRLARTTPALAATAFGAALAAGFASAPRPAPPPPRSLEVRTAELAGDEVFGPGRDATQLSAERVDFILPVVIADTGPVQVRLRHAVARTAEERIEIHAAGRPLAFAAPSSDGWRDGLELPIPIELLEPGGELRVSFVDALHGVAAGASDWNVAIPELVVEPLPSCAASTCLEQAERLHALGLRAFEAKSLGPRNLFDAWIHLHQATIFLEAMGEESFALTRTRSLRDRARGELDERCSSLRFTVMRSVALEDRAKARKAADEILRDFPESRHPCHDTGRRMLALLHELEAP
ncbi:MAG TPA: hypothetical protein VN033_11705 [Vulgatibacter sp.]|nr:hypothetical protein [Vulgatibacter sp.]